MTFTRSPFAYGAHDLLLDAVVIFIFGFNFVNEVLRFFCISSIAIATVCHQLGVDISSIELLLICFFNFLPVTCKPLPFFVFIVGHCWKLLVHIVHPQIIHNSLCPGVRANRSLKFLWKSKSILFIFEKLMVTQQQRSLIFLEKSSRTKIIRSS